MRAYPRRLSWISFGLHLDFKKKYADIHFLWWIWQIGKTPNVITDEKDVKAFNDLWDEFDTKSKTILKKYEIS